MITDGRYVVVTIGRHPYRVPGRSSRQQFWAVVGHSETFPVCFIAVKERSYWRFNGRWFWDNEGLTAEQVHALIVTRDQSRQATINRAQTMVAMAEAPAVPASRGLIPEDMKQLVWTRDQGRCRQCGSNTELQFDHIIPWSMGGATSPENLQVLCGPCNRRKGASVASARLQSSAPAPDLPPPGWYPEPSGTPGQRYWDGNTWTEHAVAD